MLIGIAVSGVVAGVITLLVGLTLGAGLALSAVGYVLGGVCGCLLFAGVVVDRRDLHLH